MSAYRNMSAHLFSKPFLDVSLRVVEHVITSL